MSTASIWRLAKAILFLQLAILCGTARGQDTAAVVVQKFIDAYNSQDIPLMQEYLADNVRWMSVTANRVSVESTGKAELAESMAGFFENIPSTHAIVHSMSTLGDFVSLIEESRWESKGEMRSNCAVSVYELQEGLIVSVWYFAAQPCSDASDD